ncbi:MAG: DEAD/DEAH box helicase [Spirochaetaceae bacterium]|nr:DEAD/DEAH box helicase [Spirochaetaceae bacterium]
MKFSEMNLDANLLRAVEEAGFVECFPVQEETFKYTLNGQDVTVQSQTGSGKTAAFLISIFHHLSGNQKFKGKKALVIVPTRELAIQIEDDARQLGKYMPYKIGSFFGGIGYGKQEAMLREGVDIIIGTPGRLIDFSRQKKINLLDVGILVIDEADRLFDMGFLPDLRKLLRKMPPAEQRLTMLLSATLGLRVSSLAWEYMNGAKEIEIDPEQVTVETITQEIYHVSSAEKLRLFLGLLKKLRPGSAIIFTNTKRAAEELSKRMEINGMRCQFIIGDLPQKKRLRIIDNMKEGLISFLVATDVAARGLHVDDLDLVVNYDIPEDAENYVHRIGRTARVGKSGLAVTLACEKYVFGLEAIEKYIGQKIPVQSFTEEDLVEDLSAGMRIRTERYGYGRDRDERHGRDDHKGRRPRRREDSPRAAPPREDAAFAEETPRREHPSGARRHAERGRFPRREDRPQGAPGKMNKEDRLAYYREKYGDDFGGQGAASPGDAAASRPRRDSGRGRREHHGRQRERKFRHDAPRQEASPAQRDQGHRRPRQEQSAKSAPPEKPQEQAAKKPGFFSKIAGFFKGKKQP